jgi:predicted ATPase
LDNGRRPGPETIEVGPGRGNLDHELTSFVGRSAEVVELTARLTGSPARLVTLTGTGGVGKTRLAVEAAWHVGGELPGGAWLVELAPLAAPSEIVGAIAESLAIRPPPGSDLLDSIVERFAVEPALLVLDNCEHLIDSVGDAVSVLLRGCPHLTVLTTSREPLGVTGERIQEVRPFDAALEGVELFHDRASWSGADLSPDDDATVAQLCARLDGIPLAIELAAARARSHRPTTLLTRVDDRFRLLQGGPRDAADRHRTMRAAIDWSYRLLDRREQVAFGRLSVFPGDFDLAAAAAVCADDTSIEEHDVADILAFLVDKSLVSSFMAADEARYRLAPTRVPKTTVSAMTTPNSPRRRPTSRSSRRQPANRRRGSSSRAETVAKNATVLTAQLTPNASERTGRPTMSWVAGLGRGLSLVFRLFYVCSSHSWRSPPVRDVRTTSRSSRSAISSPVTGRTRRSAVSGRPRRHCKELELGPSGWHRRQPSDSWSCEQWSAGLQRRFSRWGRRGRGCRQLVDGSVVRSIAIAGVMGGAASPQREHE